MKRLIFTAILLGLSALAQANNTGAIGVCQRLESESGDQAELQKKCFSIVSKANFDPTAESICARIYTAKSRRYDSILKIACLSASANKTYNPQFCHSIEVPGRRILTIDAQITCLEENGTVASAEAFPQSRSAYVGGNDKALIYFALSNEPEGQDIGTLKVGTNLSVLERKQVRSLVYIKVRVTHNTAEASVKPAANGTVGWIWEKNVHY